MPIMITLPLAFHMCTLAFSISLVPVHQLVPSKQCLIKAVVGDSLILLTA